VIQSVRAIYRDGSFRPETPCDVPENAEVELLIQGPAILRPRVTDAHERAHILHRTTERMQHNPLPPAAPRFTRDELHERR
jgi:hypothetical protein